MLSKDLNQGLDLKYFIGKINVLYYIVLDVAIYPIAIVKFVI